MIILYIQKKRSYIPTYGCLTAAHLLLRGGTSAPERFRGCTMGARKLVRDLAM